MEPAQGIMHGAASPFMTGWAGLSPFDAYPPVAQSAQSAVPPHSVPVQPHIPPLPPAMNPRFPSPMDTYFHHMLQGYPHKPTLEDKHHSVVPEPLPGFHALSKKVVDMDPYGERKSKISKHDLHNNRTLKHHTDKWQQQGGNKVAPVTTRDDCNYRFPQFHPPASTNFNVSHSGTDSGNPSTGLAWNNVFSTSVSTSTVPSSSCKPPSTSVHSMPVASSKSAAPGNGIISYYSMPHDRKNYLVPNSVEAASKEAARILEEAHQFTSGSVPLDRKLPSPFLNISNDGNRQLHNEMLYPNHVDEHKKHRPASRQSVDSLPTKSPVDFRIENILPSGRPVNSSKDTVQDFWSQFGLPPPNVDLEKMAQCSDKRGNDVLDLSDGLSNSAKRAKHDQSSNENVANYPLQDVVTQPPSEAGSERLLEERKKPEKLTRRKSFTDDPEIDALVEVKVQEIMAACRQKETHVIPEKSKLSKSPKPVHVPSKPLMNSSERLPVYQQMPPELPMPTTSSALSNHQVGASVFDFTDCDEPKKDFSYQVKDMLHVKKNDSPNVQQAPNVQHAQNMSQWTKFDPHKVGKQSAQSAPMTNGTFNLPYPSVNESYQHVNRSTVPVTKKDSYGYSYPVIGDNQNNSQRREQPLGNLPLHQINSKKNHIPDSFPMSSADIYRDENSLENKQFEFNGMYNLSKNKLTGQKCVANVQGMDVHNSGHVGSGRVSPCCGTCSSLGVRFSENCQKHNKGNKVIGNTKHDPYQFGENTYDQHQWNGLNKVNTKMHPLSPAYYNDMKPKVQYNNGFGNMAGAKMQHLERNRNIYMKQGFKPEKSQKLKPLTAKFERTQGNNNVNKKVVAKSYGLKSSLALLKKSQKFHQSKTSAAMKRKWVSNPNYKKIPKDDFAEKLKKNLGLPPLTLMEMVTKKSSKLPKAYMMKKKEKCLGSVNESKVSNVNDLKNSLSNNQIDGSSQPFFKPVQRSKSVDEGSYKTEKLTIPGPRPCSANVFNPHKMEDLSSTGPTVKVDNNVPFELNHERVKCLSEQINGLREKVTGNNINLETNTAVDVPKCGCLGPDGVCLETVEGPYYNQLGVGRSVEAIRKVMESRTGVTGKAIRIEKVRYTGKEGKSPLGCPIAKWIIRRSSEEEKYLTIVRHRPGHSCENAWLIIGLVAWEGVAAAQADYLYDFLSDTLPSHGNETERRCGTNDRKTCACQGADLMKRGASFSFGCSWSMYFNGCKFARSTHARKFRLKNEDKEGVLESRLQDLAGQVGPLYKQCAPVGHANQCHFSDTGKGQDCRLGHEKGGPFSGVTACVDFCAHAHKDIHNMNNGSTVVVTLTKHRGLSKPDDEQLHVLPLYVLEPSDEDGSYEGQYQKIQKGSLEVLHQYPLEARMRAFPLESCKKRRMNKKAGKAKNGIVNGRLSPWDSSSSTQSTPKKARQDHYHSTASLTSSADNTPIKHDRPVTIDDLRSMSSQADTAALYDKFWDYYYAFGVFPPSSILAATSISSLKSSDNATSQPSQHSGNQGDRCQPSQHSGNQGDRCQPSQHSGNQGDRCQPSQHSGNQGDRMQGEHYNTSVLPGKHVNNSPHSVPSSSTLSQSQVPNHSLVKHTDDRALVTNQPDSLDRKPAPHQDKQPNIPQHPAAAGGGSGGQYMDHSMLRMDINTASAQNMQQLGAAVQSTVPPQSRSEMQSEHSALDLSHSSLSTQPGVHTMSSMENSAKPQNLQLNQQYNSGLDNFANKSGMPSSAASHHNVISSGTTQHIVNPQPANHLGSGNQSGRNPLTNQSTSGSGQVSISSHQAMPRSSFSVNSLVQSSDLTKSSLDVASSQHHLSSGMMHSHEASSGADPRGVNISTGCNNGMYKSPDSLISNIQPSVPSMVKPSYSSPLDMLSQTVDNHSKDVGFTGTLKYSSDTVGPQNWLTQSQTPSNVLTANLPAGIASERHLEGTASDRRQELLLNGQPLPHSQIHLTGQGNVALKQEHNPYLHNNNQHREFPSLAQNVPSNNQQCWDPHGKPNPPPNNAFSVPSEVEPSLPDPDVVKCEMEYNEDAFRDPDVGGVAIALSHGAVLFEVAKRELHATTGLRNPNRYHPTRISLVFYQHKNLNNERHGMYAYESKLENMKMKRIEKMQLERGYVDMKEIENSFKGGKKRKITDEEREIDELLRSSSGEYKYMWQCNAKMASTGTTNTVTTKWIDPSPMVTGPYQKWK